MKKTVLLAALSLSTLTVASCQNIQDQNSVTIIEDSGRQKETHIAVPTLPQKVSFAGEEMPIDRFDVRERLEEDLSVTLYMHSRTLRTLRGMDRYFPYIEKSLKEAGVPDDFKYLAMAESSLNPTARSHAGAAGIWQLMSGTAKDAGLEVNNDIDERYNFEKATKVAMKYFNTAYKKFGNWTLVAASYNVGMAGVSRRQLSQNSPKSYYDVFLPEETMRYVHRIVALKLVSEDPSFYGIMLKKEDQYKPFEYKEIKVSGANISWSDVAAKNGTNYKMLRLLNPWIRTYKHANKALKSYTVKVPIN